MTDEELVAQVMEACPRCKQEICRCYDTINCRCQIMPIVFPVEEELVDIVKSEVARFLPRYKIHD